MKGIEIGYRNPVIQQYLRIKKGDAAHPKLMAVEGIWALEKIKQTQSKIIDLIYCEALIKNEKQQGLLEEMLKMASHVYRVSDKTLSRIYEKSNLGCLVFTCYKENTLSDFQHIVVLDGLENPGNIGTILRSCDGAGIDAVFVVNEKTRINQYKVVKASMGGAFSIPWFHFKDVPSCIAWLRQNDFQIYLAHPGQSSGKLNDKKTALVVGNERYGLSKAWFEGKNDILSIPMHGCCDSLNVGVAASILIYQTIGSA